MASTRDLFVQAAARAAAKRPDRIAIEGLRETLRYDQLREDLATLLDPETGTVRLAFMDSMATLQMPAIGYGRFFVSKNLEACD